MFIAQLGGVNSATVLEIEHGRLTLAFVLVADPGVQQKRTG